MTSFTRFRNVCFLLSKTSRFSSRSLNFTRSLTTKPEESSILQSESTSQEDLPVILKENPYKKEKRQCILCRLDIEPDYKNVRLLSQFQSRYTGRVYGRHITGLCKDKQGKVEREISKAQDIGLMGCYTKQVEYMKDPQLFDPEHPFKPHKY